eukprot:243341-Amphidinium_carterae.1
MRPHVSMMCESSLNHAIGMLMLVGARVLGKVKLPNGVQAPSDRSCQYALSIIFDAFEFILIEQQHLACSATLFLQRHSCKRSLSAEVLRSYALEFQAVPVRWRAAPTISLE